MDLINQLGPKSNGKLLQAIGTGIEKKGIPDTWKTSRMSLIYKGKGDKTKPSLCTPIPVTSVLYRLGIQAVKLE